MMERREHISDAGTGLTAHGGAYTFTHLQVDTETGLPRGSTPYCTRTRRDLLALVADRLFGGSQANIDDLEIPALVSRQEAAEIVVGVPKHMARRTDTQAVRRTLLFELHDDVEPRELLTTEAPVRQPPTCLAERVLLVIGADQAFAHTPDLAGLMGVLLIHQAAKVVPVNVHKVLRAYLEEFDWPAHPVA